MLTQKSFSSLAFVSKNRFALVTGGGRRIGAELARACAEDGFHVLIHYNHSAADANALAKGLIKAGQHAQTFQTDMGSADGQ